MFSGFWIAAWRSKPAEKTGFVPLRRRIGWGRLEVILSVFWSASNMDKPSAFRWSGSLRVIEGMGLSGWKRMSFSFM